MFDGSRNWKTMKSWPTYQGAGANGGGCWSSDFEENSGMNSINIQNEGPPSQLVGNTSATGIT